MNNFKVPYTEIVSITPHPNADRLSIATVYSFQVIVQKNRYKIGDKVIYIPIDSILPSNLENILFPEGSKVVLSKSRVRQIRLRKFASQGMLVDPRIIIDLLPKRELNLEEDLSNILNINKYEPPVKSQNNLNKNIQPKQKKLCNPYFKTYNGVVNIKWFSDPFVNEEVVIQEKLHGTHVRFGKAPFVANTLWKKIKKLFGLTPKYEFVYGSNNVELTNRKNHKGFYGSDIYGECLQEFDVINKIKDGEFVHGEIVGPGIQKGYSYGHKTHHLVIFDVRIIKENLEQVWLDPEESESFAKERGFCYVPVLYKGIFLKEVLEKETSGPSVYCPSERIREGCVVKPRYNYNKRSLKSINPDYLDGDHGDNH